MHSMTAYGASSIDSGSCRIKVRFRSVNHRFLDVVVRMPDELRHLEVEMRQRVADRLSRGRIELRIDLDDRRDRPVDVRVNRAWISGLSEASAALAAEGLEVGELGLRDLLRIPEAVRVTAVDRSDPDIELEALLLQAVDEALQELVASRRAEGERLTVAVRQLLEELSGKIAAISRSRERVRAELRTRLEERLTELAGKLPLPDEARLAQEVALLVERGDIREELDRLSAHEGGFREIMEQAGAVGKKLDFLAQEIARELATLAAKCRHIEVIQECLDAKLVCERIREQIQNIE